MAPVTILRKADEGKSWRWNFQHNLAVKSSNGFLVHPSIPMLRVQAVADVGTGTGIWLEDLYKRLCPTDASNERFDGFDISPSRFPKASNCTYTVHDVLKKFPGQYHGLYDLVHVRYMAVSFKSEQYETAARNIMDLLRPGGYLQWEELDYENITANPQSLIHDEFLNLVTRFFANRNLSMTCSQDVVKALKATGFESVTREERNSYWDSSLAVEIQRWAWITFNGSIARALISCRLARDFDAARIIAAEMLDKLDEEYRAGSVPNFPHRIVSGRKSICDI